LPVTEINSLLSPSGIEQFLLAFARIGSMFLPLGLPNATQSPVVARVVLSALLTLALWPVWSASAPVREPGWAFFSEISFGILTGLVVNVMLEALAFALQMVGLQSGYQYASTIDPTSQADSPVLPVLGQLLGFALFFALRGDHLVVRMLARSFLLWPPGAIPQGRINVEVIIRAGASILEYGLRFALPLLALLLLVDLAMGVVTRAHAQLQLITIAFPLKMMLALFTLGALLPVWTNLFGTRLSAVEAALLSLIPAG